MTPDERVGHDPTDPGLAVAPTAPTWALPDVVPIPTWAATYDEQLHQAYRLIARHLYRRRRLGAFAYAAFDHINATHFAAKLPETLLLWDLTEYGHCLGWTRSAADGPPIIKLHPAVVSPAPRPPALADESIWGFPPTWFGLAFAYDVLLHECVHVTVNYLHGGWETLSTRRSYWTSHNNPVFVAECNRLAPMLGYTGDPFTMKIPTRVIIPGVLTKSGTPKTKTVRIQAGDAPDFERFPYSLPCREARYLTGTLPFPWEMVARPVEPRASGPPVSDNTETPSTAPAS
jgi:hypothetical protein